MPDREPTRTNCDVPPLVRIFVGRTIPPIGSWPFGTSGVVVQVRPPSVVFRIPRAGPPSPPRLLHEPVVANSVLLLGSRGLKAMPPVASVPSWSVRGVQTMAVGLLKSALFVTQMPPLAVAAYI